MNTLIHRLNIFCLPVSAEHGGITKQAYCARDHSTAAISCVSCVVPVLRDEMNSLLIRNYHIYSKALGLFSFSVVLLPPILATVQAELGLIFLFLLEFPGDHVLCGYSLCNACFDTLTISFQFFRDIIILKIL